MRKSLSKVREEEKHLRAAGILGNMLLGHSWYSNEDIVFIVAYLIKRMDKRVKGASVSIRCIEGEIDTNRKRYEMDISIESRLKNLKMTCDTDIKVSLSLMGCFVKKIMRAVDVVLGEHVEKMMGEISTVCLDTYIYNKKTYLIAMIGHRKMYRSPTKGWVEKDI